MNKPHKGQMEIKMEKIEKKEKGDEIDEEQNKNEERKKRRRRRRGRGRRGKGTAADSPAVTCSALHPEAVSGAYAAQSSGRRRRRCGLDLRWFW